MHSNVHCALSGNRNKSIAKLEIYLRQVGKHLPIRPVSDQLVRELRDERVQVVHYH